MTKKLPDSVKRKISQAQKGKNNSMYGKHHADSTCRELAKINTGKNNPMYGKRHSDETRRKISLTKRRKRTEYLKKMGIIK